MKRTKKIFCIAVIFLFGLQSECFGMRRFLKTPIKLFQARMMNPFLSRSCKRLLYHPKGFFLRTISCDDCTLGGNRECLIPYTGCCSKFVQEKKRKKETGLLLIDQDDEQEE